MATSVKLKQERGVVTSGVPAGGTDGQYYVINTCSEATVATANFDNNFFLFAEADDSYQHVCTVGDLEAYPDTKTGGIAYYRQDAVTQFFDVLDDAWDHANLVKTRMQNLVDDWESYVNDPAGPFTTTGPDHDTNTYTSS